MPLQSLYLDQDGLRVGNNQLLLQSNAVYVGNNLYVANTITIGNTALHSGTGTLGLQPYGSNNALTITTSSPAIPNPYAGAIDMRVGAARQIGISFSSLQNAGSDFGYIWYYDNLTGGYVATGGSENSALVIGVQNDNGATAINEDVLALESSGNMYLNPGTGVGSSTGSTTSGNTAWTAAQGNLYVGNNSVRYLVMHEGITANTTLRSSVSYTAGANSIQFTNTTSNYIAWNTSGVTAPTVTTRSNGTKLLLWPGISATQVDYAIGVETNHMWFSVANTDNGFKWYANTTQVMLSNTTALYVNSGISYTGTAYTTPVSLTDGATISWAATSAQVATVTIAGNRTVAAPTGLTSGAFYSLEVIQDATGSRTLAWNSVFKWTNATAPVLSIAASARDYFVFRSDGTNLYEQGRSLGVA
jgi:hypothetical protein